MENPTVTNANSKNSFVRQTAYQLWIGDLVNGVFIKGRGDYEASYLALRGLNVSRVNLIGVVISSNNNESFSSLDIEDSSGAIAIRAWKDDSSKLNGFEVGNFVLVVGKIRNFNNSFYVIPDFVRKLEGSDWFKLRKIQLEKKYGKFVKLDPAINTNPNHGAPILDENVALDIESQDMEYAAIQEEVMATKEIKVTNVANPTALINNLITDEDKGEGADIALVIAKSGLDETLAQKVIDELIRGGEIFEVRPGYVRSLI